MTLTCPAPRRPSESPTIAALGPLRLAAPRSNDSGRPAHVPRTCSRPGSEEACVPLKATPHHYHHHPRASDSEVQAAARPPAVPAAVSSAHAPPPTRPGSLRVAIEHPPCAPRRAYAYPALAPRRAPTDASAAHASPARRQEAPAAAQPWWCGRGRAGRRTRRRMRRRLIPYHAFLVPRPYHVSLISRPYHVSLVAAAAACAG